jgi:hypothetical protein
VQRDLAERPDDTSQGRRDVLSGYGSSARWANDAFEDRR